jgi:GTP-binding protein EngB required for normal cell division
MVVLGRLPDDPTPAPYAIRQRVLATKRLDPGRNTATTATCRTSGRPLRLATAAELLGVSEVADLAAETAGRLKTLRLEVAVVGEFKRGKSSLINALIGREVLPVGVLPLTAVPTVLEQGEDGLVVEFADGRQEHHPLRQVARFVTEEANPGNRLGVARVTARLHTPLLDAGVRLVDTPGVGSVHEHNTRSTDAYLPSLDAAVLVTSADPPISRAERAFLQRVLGHAVRLFVVLNKADYLAAGDLDRTVAFTGAVVRQVLPDWPGPVYPLSARPGAGNPDGLRRFGDDLARFLHEERAAVVTDSARRSAARGLGSLRLALDLERRAASLPAEELATRRAQFAAVVDRLASDAADDAALLGAAVRRGLEALDETLAPHRAELARRAEQATIQAAERHPDAGPGRLLELLQAERPAMLEGLSGELVERAGAAAVAAYRQATAAVTKRAANRVQRLQAEAASTFGVPLPDFVAPDLDLGIAKVSFSVPRVTLLAEQLASASWRLLGARAARARAIARAREQAAEEAQMLLGRLRGATSEQLGEAARQLGARLQRHQAALATGLSAAIERGGGLLAEAEDRRQRRTLQLERAADLLQEVAVGLQRQPATPGGQVNGRSLPAAHDDASRRQPA